MDIQKKYIPNDSLAQILNKKTPNLGDKYKTVQTNKEAKIFLLGLITEFVAQQTILNATRDKIKNKYLKDYKDLLLKKAANPKEILFNNFLRIGLTGYWSGGVWGAGTIANVIFPGTVTIPVTFKSTANPGAFIESLSMAFQAHTKTITGTITFPGTPPVVVPWSSYNSPGWKVVFEQPLIKMIQAGTIGNSQQLVQAIVLQYDICIKQGLAGPPGAAAGPFIAGKPILLEQALMNFYRIESIAQKSQTITLYLDLIKSIYSRIKEISKEGRDIKREMSKTISDQKTVSDQISRLSKQNTIESKRTIQELTIKQNNLKAKQFDAMSKLQAKKDELTTAVQPKITAIKEQLQSLVIRITVPPAQDTKLKSLANLPKQLRDTVLEMKNKKQDLLSEIEKNKKTINDATRAFNGLNAAMTSVDSSAFRTAVNTAIKSTSIDSTIKASKTAIGIINKYPDKKISIDKKNNCNNAMNKIVECKLTIDNKKREIEESIQSKLTDKKNQLVSTFKPKFEIGPSKIQEMAQDRKQIKNILEQLKQTVNETSITSRALVQCKSEYSKVASA